MARGTFQRRHSSGRVSERRHAASCAYNAASCARIFERFSVAPNEGIRRAAPARTKRIPSVRRPTVLITSMLMIAAIPQWECYSGRCGEAMSKGVKKLRPLDMSGRVGMLRSTPVPGSLARHEDPQEHVNEQPRSRENEQDGEKQPPHPGLDARCSSHASAHTAEHSVSTAASEGIDGRHRGLLRSRALSRARWIQQPLLGAGELFLRQCAACTKLSQLAQFITQRHEGLLWNLQIPHAFFEAPTSPEHTKAPQSYS